MLLRQQGQRAPTEADVDLTKSDEDDGGEEKDDKDDGLANSVWTKKLQQANTAQRKKKQTSMAYKKPNHTTVLYIKARST